MQTVLVTGSSGNLGHAVVKKFIDGGWTVAGSLLLQEQTPSTLNHANFKPFNADLSDEAAASSMVASVIEACGSIDAAVLTVGGFAMGSIAETDMTAMLGQYKLNFQTTYQVARPVFVQMMKQGHGRLFMTGARTGINMNSSKGMTAYGLSKSLIFRLAELMNAEAKGHDVVTSVIAPSIIDTPPNRRSMPDADFDNWVRPEDIANTVWFYCSKDAAAIREPVLKIYNNS
ncbi:MAG TPA: SDR family NAD(P)-dependent oxidoreductase [Chitinophagaceae bacterium]|jgi:NAD(P)-dependent dehydrogenase (short-subunit alcohol dehydrogenase family)